MAQRKRPIFRQKALKQYAQSSEKTILPRTLTPPVFVCFWILLGLLVTAGILAWLEQVPTVITGSGVIQSIQTRREGPQITAYIFLPANTASSVQTGQPVRLQIGSTGQQITSTVSTVESVIISPAEASQRFALGSSTLQVISEPSVVVTIQLGTASSTHNLVGSIVHAQVQVGTQRVLSLLPGFNALLGE